MPVSFYRRALIRLDVWLFKWLKNQVADDYDLEVARGCQDSEMDIDAVVRKATRELKQGRYVVRLSIRKTLMREAKVMTCFEGFFLITFFLLKKPLPGIAPGFFFGVIYVGY